MIPESYRVGVSRIESMDLLQVGGWLPEELRGEQRLLAGSADDFPVQAIVNHFQFLSLLAQKRVTDSIDRIIAAWCRNPDSWSGEALAALLSLAAELRVSYAKAKLKNFILSSKEIDQSLRADVLRTIATLSSNADETFWSRVGSEFPRMCGMAFQVLTRIAPFAAVRLLAQLPDDEAVIGSVERRLPDFLSEYPGDERLEILIKIGESLGSLPDGLAMKLQEFLKGHGFSCRIRRAEVEASKRFEIQIETFSQMVSRKNRLVSVYG